MPPAISRNDWSETASDPNIAESSNFTGAPDADDCQPGPRRLSRGPSAKQASETAGSRDHNQLFRVEVKEAYCLWMYFLPGKADGDNVRSLTVPTNPTFDSSGGRHRISRVAGPDSN